MDQVLVTKINIFCGGCGEGGLVKKRGLSACMQIEKMCQAFSFYSYA